MQSLLLLDQARHFLCRHLDDLREALAVVGERLRDAVAHSVGGTVSGAAREIVRGLLASPQAAPYPASTSPPVSAWGSHYSPARDPYEDDHNGWSSDWPDRSGYEEETPVAAPPAMVAPAPLRWARALAVGSQAVAWWLRRQASQGSTWVTLGLGLVVALAAYWAGAAVSTFVLSLLTLADAPHAPSSTQAWPSSR